jgi:predicted lipoprotein with Yx(FWY)xxD motif
LPAATVAAGGDWTHIRRDDGTMQLAYKGKPLYYWVRDAKPGDRTGDGVNNVWHWLAHKPCNTVMFWRICPACAATHAL